MPAVTLELRSDSDHRDVVELDDLSPMARALAETIGQRPLRDLRTIWLQTMHPIRDIVPADEIHFWDVERLSEPHRIPWSTWANFPTTSAQSPVAYLEAQARCLPVGYHPIGADFADPLPGTQPSVEEDAAHP